MFDFDVKIHGDWGFIDSWTILIGALIKGGFAGLDGILPFYSLMKFRRNFQRFLLMVAMGDIFGAV